MKRKFTCMILALVLVISLLPLGAIPTQAASNLNYSENVVNLIKQFEGFSASAYWDVNQWTIGYGTTGYAGQTISEAEADLVLRDRLNTINQKINLFTATQNVNLNQYQHDALVCFSFSDFFSKFCCIRYILTNKCEALWHVQLCITSLKGREFLFQFSLKGFDLLLLFLLTISTTF